MVFIVGDTLRHQPMVVGHMPVPQFRGPITYCVLQWCHPMLTVTQRRTSCSTRMITLYGDHAIKLDSGPRRFYIWVNWTRIDGTYMLGQMQPWTEVDITSFLHIGRKNLAVAIIGLQYQTPGE